MRGEIAEKGDKPALGLERFVACSNDGAIDVGSRISRKTLAQRLPSHRHAIKMEQWLEFAQKRAHSAAGKKILHIAIADRLQIDQHGRRVGELIELIETNLYAGAPRDRGEVNDRIGRTAERQENAQRVVHRLCVDDAVGGAV